VKHKRIIAEFWADHYEIEVSGVGGYCVLCGNTGIINTTKSAHTPRGLYIGQRVYCFCPNGRALGGE